MKRCKVEGCDNYVFGKGYCKYHQHKRPDKGYKTGKNKAQNKQKGFTPGKNKRGKKIKPVSEKRKKENKIYRYSRQEFIDYKKDQGEFFCIFCGNGFRDENEPHVHHVYGRDDDLLLDMDFWELAHGKCHMEYHHGVAAKVEDDWYSGYLQRIKDKYPNKYFEDKERLRRSKLN